MHDFTSISVPLVSSRNIINGTAVTSNVAIEAPLVTSSDSKQLFVGTRRNAIHTVVTSAMKETERLSIRAHQRGDLTRDDAGLEGNLEANE